MDSPPRPRLTEKTFWQIKYCRSLTNPSLLIHLFIKELVRAIDWEMRCKQCTWTIFLYGVEVLCTLLCTSTSGKSKASSSLAWITLCNHPAAKTISLKYKSYRTKMFLFDLLLATPLATFVTISWQHIKRQRYTRNRANNCPMTDMFLEKTDKLKTSNSVWKLNMPGDKRDDNHSCRNEQTTGRQRVGTAHCLSWGARARKKELHFDIRHFPPECIL